MVDTLDTNEEVALTLDNLKEGKFHIGEIPRTERLRLAKEERETLPDEAKEIWDSVGWRTKHFFLGKKKDGSEAEWKDWTEFDNDIKTKLPVANERLKTVTREKIEADAKIERLERQIAQLSATQKLQLERDLKKDKSEVESEMREARNSGDVDKFAAAQEKKVQIEFEENTLKTFEPQQPVRDNLTPERIQFEANNPWFNSDKEMTRYAIGFSTEIAKDYPHLTQAQNLRMVEDEMKVQYAHKLSKGDKAVPPAVESGRSAGSMSSTNRGAIAFEQLPNDEQSRVERMIRSGHVKSKADYMKGFNERNNKK